MTIETDTHTSASRGVRALARKSYLRLLDRRVRCWLPGGTPQAEHLRATFTPRAPVVLERMTTDTRTLFAEARRLGPGAGAAWRAAQGVPASAPLALHVGRLAPEKGVADLLAAAAALSREGLALHVALLGPGDAAASLPASFPRERLVAPGRVPWRALVPAYLAADVLVLASRFEPWGLVVNEALALGCPVVVTDAVGAARDLVSGPGAGEVVPAGDVGALAAAMRRVIEAGGRSSPFARRGREAMRGWTTEAAGRRLARVWAGAGGGA